MHSPAVSEDGALKVLLVEDRAADARLAGVALSSGRIRFRIRVASRLTEALEQMAVEPFDVVLLDLGLPDSQGLQTFAVVHAHFRAVPIVVLSGLDDEQTAVDAVRLGAQDYLVKGTYDNGLLERAIQYAIERQRVHDQLVRAVAYTKQASGEASASGDRAGAPADRLALCAWCKRVHGDETGWQTIEEYLSLRTQSLLTHGMCPNCAEELATDPAGGGSA